MTCTEVKRRNAKVKLPAKPRNGRIAIGVLVAVLLVAVAIGVALHLRNVAVEQQTQVELRDDLVAELERNEGTYDAQSIVLYNTSRAKAEELAEKFGASLRMTKDGKFATLTLPEGTTILDVCRDEENLAYIDQMSADYQVRISEITEVEGEEEQDNTRLPMRPTYSVSDTDYELQTYLDYMNMQNVWANYTGKGVTVAVIDTGIDTDHPEFAGRISEYSYNATEDKIVKDYVLENGEYDWSLVEDEQGHGTAVTGVIAASMNSGNVVGIAPNVTIITIKAECNEAGEFERTSDLVFGLYYAIERDVSVVNMSFGIYGNNPFAGATQLAYDSDVICVAAAGNESTAALTYPAADPLVIGVGALADGSWELAEYSNYGENVNVVAPGTTYTSLVGGEYGSMDGTSLASPAVAGMIALYMQNNPYIMFDQVTEELYASCYDLGDLGRDWYYGFGAVDANAFLIEERGTITYDMLTDEVDDMEGTFIRGHALQELPEPDRLYAIFDGWYYDQHCTQRVEYYSDAFYGDITLYANWVNEDDGIPFTYVILEDGTVEIRSYTGHRRFITVPEKIEGRVVSSIGDGAFAGQSNLREVGLPSGLRHIGSSAFSGCYNLVSVYIPANVTAIEEAAFQNCVRLSTVAFTGQSKLLTIGNSAFASCGKLRTIELPASLQSINGTAFVGTSALTNIRVQSDNQYFKSEDGVLFDISGETLVAYPAANGTTYIIPESVKTVDSYAFYGAKVLYLDFGSIQTIGECAFAFSSVLTVNIPDSVIYMGQGAFMLSAVKELTIGSGLTEIAGAAFSQCGSLESVHIPEGIVCIKTGAFQVSKVRTLTFAENSTLIGIDDLAFAGCTLTEVEIPASVVYIGSCSSESKELSYYDIPERAPLQGAFDASRLSSITFEEGSQLRIIGDRAFAYCRLSGIDFPEGLEHLGVGAFWSNPLETIVLPASITQLDEAAFGDHPVMGTSRLSSIIVAEGNTIYHDINGVIYNLENTEIHAFPAGRTGEYAVFDTVQKVMPYSFAGTTQLERVTLSEGLTEIGNYAFAYSGCYTYDLPSTLKYIKNGGFCSNYRLNSITLPEGLEQIAEYAFKGCSVLPTIHIPDSVLQIGRYAFAMDWNLYSVTFNETAKLPRISYGAFSYCGLETFRVPANVSTMAQGAFARCYELTAITFAENSKLESISAYVFDDCTNLQTITFEEGSALTSVQAHGFEGMNKLTQINWGDAKVTNIDNFAFRFCESLSNLTLPDTVTNVGRYAFYGCKSLSELTLPVNVEHIGMFAFLGTGDLNLYLTADTMPAYLDEDWDHGIRGYYVGVTSVETQGDYKYATLTSGDVSIIEYLGNDTEIDLSVLDFGAPISAIGGSAFEDKGITRVTLPDTLTSIQAEAFAYNPLCEITIPAGVTFIGREAFTYTEIASLTFAEDSQIKTIEQYAFERTRNLTEVTLPASLTTLGRGVFQQSGLTSVTFEEGIALERIPQNAFTETKLTSIALPDSVNYIDHNAFMEIPTLQSVTFGNAENILLQSNSFYHTGLTSLHIPANVTYIGEYSFVALSNLTKITVDENNPWYKSEDGLLLSKDGRKLIVVPAGRMGSLTVPVSVEMLGFGAFEETKLSEVKFDPDANILTLGYRSFFKANNITSIDIPKSVISIDYYAFAYCENLQSVNFAKDNQLKGIYEGAFLGDINLENITIPDTIVEISDFAFYDCSKLDRIPISENNAIKGIHSYAFAYTGIAGEFTTPETLIDIGDYAFLGTKITKLTVPDTNQWDLIIGIGAFEDCYKLEEVTLPFIGASLDDQQYSWLGYIFGAGAYEANATYVPESLKTVTITEGQTLVGFGGFAYLTSVETLYLPHSICTLYNDAFMDTTARYELTNTIMTWYQPRKQPRKYVLPYAVSGHFGPGLTGHLELAGPCVLSDNTFTDGVVEIKDKAFSGCEQLTSITIPTTVTWIGASAFSDCSSLINIELPDSITSIGYEAFSGCSSLKSIIIPEGITRIEVNTFYACSSLTTVILPDSLVQIDGWSFNYCTSLGEITIPKNVSYIGGNVFNSCDKLHLINNLSALEISPYGSKIVKDAEGNIQVSPTENLTLDSDGFLWGVSDGRYLLYAYLGNEDSVTLPQSIEGNPYELSYFSTSAKHIIIPEGVTQIGYKAFEGCRELEQITIPASVEKIKAEAFANCSSLKTLIIPENVVSIGEKAFAGCTELETVQMSDSVTTMGYSVFENCTSLTSVKLSAGLQTITAYMFEGCTSLQMVEIPYGVTEIHRVAFSGCISLEQILIPDSVVEIGPIIAPATTDLIFYGDNPRFQVVEGVIYDVQLTEVVTVLDQVTHVSIHSGVTSIGECAFSEIESLKQVVIPYSVTSIGEYAFNHCSNLTSIAIPDSVTSIGRGAFSGCSSLTSVVIPDSVTSIGADVFLQCTNLQNVVLPSDLTYIPNSMFAQCDSLTDINISDGVTIIGDEAFKDCYGLTSIELPEGVQTIGSYAFVKCSKLTSVQIPSSVTYIGPQSFSYCESLERIDVDERNDCYISVEGVLYDKNITEIIAIPGKAKVTIIIPEGTEYINEGLFNYTSITQVIIPDSVTHIGDYAFNFCAYLTSVDIPDSVTHIGMAAFQGCERLERVSIGAGVVEIGECSFNNNTLKEFIVSEDNAVYQSIGGILYDKQLTTIISVPLGIQGEVVIPSGVTTIAGFNNCDNLTSVVISDGVSIIGKSAFANCSNLRYVEIPISVTRIERMAFYGCEGLSSIILPNNLEYIGERAFYDCLGLVSVTIQNNIATIEDNAFYGFNHLYYVKNDSDLPIRPRSDAFGKIASNALVVVDKDGQHIYASDQNYTMDEQGFIYGELEGKYTLYAYFGESNVVYLPKDIQGNTYSIYGFATSAEHIVIPEGVTSIDDYAFGWCMNVKSIELPDSITSIGDSAFYFCKSLENLIIPYGVENIDHAAFSGCVSLNSIILPETVTYIGEDAFRFCSGLKEVSLPKGITQISSATFCGCTSLLSITIPDSVTVIGSGAFDNCISLLNATIPNSVTVIGDNAFAYCTSFMDIDLPDGLRYIGERAFKNTAYVNDMSHWTDGTISLDGWLLKLNTETKYFDVYSYRGAAADAYEGCNLLKIAIWNSPDYDIGTNVETIVVKHISHAHALHDLPGTLKNIVITTDVDLTELRDNPMFFIEASGVTIYVEGNEKDLRWDDNFPGWNYGNRVVYGDKWTWGIFYDKQGTIISMEPRKNEQIIRKPIMENTEDVSNSYILVGWDINSDGIVDSVPATMVTDFLARPVYNVIPKEYTIVFKDGNSGEIFKQETLYFGDVITAPKAPTREDGFLIGWIGYKDGITVCSNAEFLSNWHIHEYALEITNPTCTEYGYTMYTCNCGDTYVSDEVAALGHDMGEWYQTITPTCTTEGENKRDCSRCEHFETEVVPANGHVSADAVEENHIDPTCTEIGGYDMVVYCNVCGVELSREHYDIEALGHDMGEWYQTIAPTCTTEGENKRDCSRCEHFETEVVPANGHTPADVVVENRIEPTCTDIGGYDNVINCTACEAELSREHIEISANGHTPADAVEENHVDSTCTEIGGYDMVVYCAVCGAELSREHHDIETLGHAPATEWTEDVAPTCTTVGSKSHHCTRCDEKLDITEIPANGHNHVVTVTAPTCIEQGYTTHTCHCGDVYVDSYVDALGHTEAIDAAVAPTCTETGLTEGKHCSVCNEILLAQEVVPANGHNHDAVITAPTCTEKGCTTHTCHCGDSYVDSEAPALGHTPSDWIVDAEAQIGVEGSKHKECTACGETLETEVIEALTETPTTEAPTTEPEPSGGCNGTISASVALLALLSCFAVAWHPRKDN